MKNFSSEFRKSVNEMKPDKSEILHTVRNSGRNTGIVPVRQGFGARVGSILTAGLAVVLVFGIIVGGGLLRGMKKPLSPGGNDYSHGSTNTELIHYGTDYDTYTSTCHYGPPDTSADSETEPPSSGTEYPEDTNTEPPTDSAPVDPPDSDPDIVFSYDPIDDFGIDVRDEIEITGNNTVEINKRAVRYSCVFFDAVYTVGGAEKTGRMYTVIGDSLTFEGTDMHVPSLYLILYDPQTNEVVAAKKWLMAGGIFVNSDVPGTFLVAGVSFDMSDDVYGYFGVYRVTDSVTGKPEFVLDNSYDSCKIHQITFPSGDQIPEDVFTEYLRNKKDNDNYYQRLRKLIEDGDFGEILDMYGGIACMAAEISCTPWVRRSLNELDLTAFLEIASLPYNFGKN